MEEYSNKVEIITLDEETGEFPKEAQCSFTHPYPCTKILFIPDKECTKEDLLATTGDYLRIWQVQDDNTVQMNLLAATTDNDDATDQVYNVALNDRTSLNKLYQMIEERIIKRTEGIEKKEPIYTDFRQGDVRHSQANIDKAQALLDYQPKYMISQGMDETMDWYVNNVS